MADFVFRNGKEFENQIKKTEQDNPKYKFLYGGEFHNYYLHRLEALREYQISKKIWNKKPILANSIDKN